MQHLLTLILTWFTLLVPSLICSLLIAAMVLAAGGSNELVQSILVVGSFGIPTTLTGLALVLSLDY